MKIAEFYKDKKNKEKIKLFFTNKNLEKEIKKIPSSRYFPNTKQWMLLHNNISIKILDNLDFTMIHEDFNIELTANIIIIDNNYIIIETSDIAKYLILKKFIFFDTKNCFSYGKYDFSKAKQVNFFDFSISKHHLLIPIGLKDILEKLEIKTNRKIDIRKKLKNTFSNDEIKNCLNNIQLRDYQIDIIQSMLNKTNGIIKSPTGSGKTEMFIAFLKLTKLKTLILTSSIDITQQTKKRIIDAELDCGIVQGDNVDYNHNIVISTIQSIHKLEDEIKNFECVIVDECHEISEEYLPVLSMKNFIYRFGFSATPLTKVTLKNAIIKSFIGGIIYELGTKELQEKNNIAVPYINMIMIDNKKLNIDSKNWNYVERMLIINNEQRNNKIINICRKLKKQKLILVKKIEHGHILQKLFENEQIKSKYIHGGISSKDRQKILDEYEENSNNFILIGSKVLFTGINLQNIYNLIIACGGNSYIEVIQSLGRALRSRTKIKVNIFDFYDSNNKITERHSINRVSYYKIEGFHRIKYIEG